MPLSFAERAQVKAAYLIDPVDNTDFTPESADYPSAIRALLQSGQPVGISGAGIVGRCNPNGSNYKARAENPANGSGGPLSRYA